MRYLCLIFMFLASISFANDYGNWENLSKIDEFTEKEDNSFILPSKNSKVFVGVRCLNNSTEFFMALNNLDFFPFGDDYTKIGIKIDDEKPYYEKASLSTTSRGFFINKPIKFLQKLKGHSKLIIRYEPYGSNEKNAIFELEGIEAVIEKISTNCNWK